MVAKVFLPLMLLFVATPSISAAQSTTAKTSTEPIRYTISFPAPDTHYMEVTAVVPTAGRRTVELMMAVWTPGSYLIREYQRNVERVSASSGGRALGIEKSEKNRWRITTGGAGTVTVSYGVYAHEMSVRTNWVESRFALINGAPTFMTLADDVVRPHEVLLNLPAAWSRSMSGLRELSANRYVAPDYDTLVDSPIVAGNPVVLEFTIDGKRHFLVNEGDLSEFDGARAVKDVEALFREQRRFWGALPYDKYVILNVIVENRGGGLEHKNSQVLLAARATTRSRAAYLLWLTTVSHEIFHLWNGKRLRPVELGPFDYEKEALTRSLWIVEGLSDYYGDLLTHRAGLMAEDEFLASLSSSIGDLQTTPGRQIQSVELASYDAWIRYYRPDENSPNVSISYYVKGQVLGFLLDAHIRRMTNGARSLDDVMRAAHMRYSGDRGFTGEQFREIAERVAGASLADFWNRWVKGTEELQYTEALTTFGLRFLPGASAGRPSLGVSTRNDQGRLVVTQVRREIPVTPDTLNPDDEILAIDDRRVRADALARRLDQYRPGDRISVLVARRDQLLRLQVVLETSPPQQWELGPDPAATDAQRTRRSAWLKPPQ